MSKHTLKEWFIVTRYWSFTVSAMPVIASCAYLFAMGMLPTGFKTILLILLSVLGSIVLHASGNVLSDYFDYKYGVDNKESFSIPFLVFQQFKPEGYLRFSILLFTAGILIGIAIFLLSGPTVLIIGGIGVVLTVLYSLFKFHALGDLDIFIIFGILPMLGSSYVLCGEIVWPILVLSLPIGLITVSVLHANNTRDMDTDTKAGINTFASLLGVRVSCVLYALYMVLPFLFVFVAVLFKLLPMLSLLSFVALIPAMQNLKTALSYKENGVAVMNNLDQASAKLQTAFSVCLSLGLLISAFI